MNTRSRCWLHHNGCANRSRRHFLLNPDEARQMEQVYWHCLANPVEAWALRYAKDWPGAHTLPGHVGTRVIKVKRPPHYFDPNNPEWPEELELRLQMPVALAKPPPNRRNPYEVARSGAETLLREGRDLRPLD